MPSVLICSYPMQPKLGPELHQRRRRPGRLLVFLLRLLLVPPFPPAPRPVDALPRLLLRHPHRLRGGLPGLLRPRREREGRRAEEEGGRRQEEEGHEGLSHQPPRDGPPGGGQPRRSGLDLRRSDPVLNTPLGNGGILA